MVMEVVHEDMGEGSMQCTNHPYKNSTPQGGICAFCLQEKLGKLVSSSFPLPVFPSSSSSSSPSFRSDFSTAAVSGGAAASSLQVRHHLTSSRLPFAVPTHKKKKKKDVGVNVGARAAAMGGGGGGADSAAVVFKRSKSTATPRRGTHLYDENSFDLSPHRRGFWSFLYNNPKRIDKHHTSRDSNFTPSTVSSTVGSSSIRSRAAAAAAAAVAVTEKKREEFIVVDENESPDEAAFDRKVSRSRSVGCGSRSFSGDFFERISTGFGDCTLRRVESQREGKPKIGTNGQDCIKERVKCGGIFSGFMITSSSSSSSSSSYLDNNNNNAANSSLRHHNLAHGRSKSWGWALASPMRAFTKNSTTGKRDAAKNAAPNLAAIPSLLAVSG